MTFYIYLVCSLRSGKKYVGQTRQGIQARWSQHRCEAKRRKTTYLHRAIHKYGAENFSISILEEVFSQEDANLVEGYWITHFQSNLREFGYNSDSIGRVKLPSPETRLKQSEAQKRRFAKPGALARLSEDIKRSHPGITVANRALVSKRQLGDKRNVGRIRGPHSVEHREKIAEARRGKATPRFIIQKIDENGVVLATYSSASVAAKTLGICAATILRCARGGTPVACGFKWRIVGQNYSVP